MLRRTFVSALGAAVATPAFADDWPNKQIKAVIPYPPGGPTDISMRIVMEKAGQILGQPILFDNKGGASGMIGAEYAKTQPPDGYTFLGTTVAMVAITGPEVVTGSTRLKAGTATKMILNMITTGAMIRLGKTWGNLMVDLRATNIKLKDRSERILMETCGISRDDARALLEAADGSVKVGIVMHRTGVSRDDAVKRIHEAGGLIRRVVGDP